MKTSFTGLKKLPTGISGLDEVLHGTIPKGRTTLVIGEAGAGNFVRFEEAASQLRVNALFSEWDITQMPKRSGISSTPALKESACARFW